MKIKTRLQIAVILTLIISVTVSLFIFSAYKGMNEWGQKEMATGRISRNIAELKIVTHEYLLHPVERSLMQWKASRDSLARLLAEEINIFEDSGEKDALKKTLKSLERFSDIFAELATIPGEEREYDGHHKNGISKLKVKLTGDLLVESQAMVSKVFLVNQVIDAKLISIQRKTGLLIVILFVVFIGLVSVISLWISRSIGAPITRLEKGIRIIGGGNLGPQVGTDAKDEIGHLSRAFDGMTDDLKKTTMSMVALNREIDARKKAEGELKSHQEHLALINQILRHDLTNDLVVIQSAQNLYSKSPEEEYLNEISTRTEKSFGLINRMKDLESFISRHRELKMYKMKDILKETVENYPSTAFKIKGDCQVMADDSISSVIDNIVANAIAHGKADSIAIKIHEAMGMCEVRIADNGTGIPDEIKEKVFDEGFMHGDNAHTGIGLHIVKKAMESYGGYAYIEDNKPNGAVIALRFRMVK